MAELGMRGRSAGKTGELKIKIGIGDDAKLLGGSNAPRRSKVGSELQLYTIHMFFLERP